MAGAHVTVPERRVAQLLQVGNRTRGTHGPRMGVAWVQVVVEGRAALIRSQGQRSSATEGLTAARRLLGSGGKLDPDFGVRQDTLVTRRRDEAAHA